MTDISNSAPCPVSPAPCLLSEGELVEQESRRFGAECQQESDRLAGAFTYAPLPAATTPATTTTTTTATATPPGDESELAGEEAEAAAEEAMGDAIGAAPQEPV